MFSLAELPFHAANAPPVAAKQTREASLSLPSHWPSQDSKALLSHSESIWGAPAALTRMNLCRPGTQLTARFSTPSVSFCFPSFCPHSEPQPTGIDIAAVIRSIMTLAKLFVSKHGLVLSALIVCAVIFELGKWLFSSYAHLWGAQICWLHSQSVNEIYMLQISCSGASHALYCAQLTVRRTCTNRGALQLRSNQSLWSRQIRGPEPRTKQHLQHEHRRYSHRWIFITAHFTVHAGFELCVLSFYVTKRC